MDTQIARKFFISQFFQTSFLTDSNNFQFASFIFKTVRIQGIIIDTFDNVNSDGDLERYHYIDDGSGLARIGPLPVSSDLKAGSHVAVIGELTYDLTENIFSIGAISRVFDKSHDPNAETTWMIEVVSVHREGLRKTCICGASCYVLSLTSS
ncbi:hypothetical protein HK097_007312 [Rhizophlyctis rosea]|uniref:Uncharacterized protein n=1 Tax=Rhizophlyctis rosea TaxID=64517 RepID=A0AAD5X5V3_9FUNG|nr:hypothetical protein HK097_007312 [Rhizophlyctis rosea]